MTLRMSSKTAKKELKEVMKDARQGLHYLLLVFVKDLAWTDEVVYCNLIKRLSAEEKKAFWDILEESYQYAMSRLKERQALHGDIVLNIAMSELVDNGVNLNQPVLGTLQYVFNIYSINRAVAIANQLINIEK